MPNKLVVLVSAVGIALLRLAVPAAGSEPDSSVIGFVVVAPDRGFQGNEEVRDALGPFASHHLARLVLITDERSGPYLRRAVSELRAEGAQQLVFLPLFVSPSHPRLALARRLADEVAADAIWARPFGSSYLAVEALADRLRRVEGPTGSRLVVVASGAEDEASRETMATELERLAGHAASGFGFASVRSLIAPQTMEDLPELEEAFDAGLAALAPEGSVVVPFDQGAKLDGMMRFEARLARKLPEGVTLLAGDLTPDPLVGLWLKREANRHLPVPPERLGVVALAHGSEFDWNETIRRSVAPLQERFLVEPCFSMADPDLLERAIRRLEVRGARAVVVVRIFGMEASFRDSVERMLGLDVEGPEGLATVDHDHHVGNRGSAHGGNDAPPRPRIRTALPAVTAGGLEDHPLFARALLDRALSLSEDASNELVLLVAHGLGDDEGNNHWQEVLSSIAEQMRHGEEGRFAAIETVTWREDWPDKREPNVARARSIVERATREGRRVLVIPARTTGQGPAAELLEGLDFSLGEGFAPHPLFAEWVEEQVIEGAARLSISGVEKLVAALTHGGVAGRSASVRATEQSAPDGTPSLRASDRPDRNLTTAHHPDGQSPCSKH